MHQFQILLKFMPLILFTMYIHPFLRRYKLKQKSLIFSKIGLMVLPLFVKEQQIYIQQYCDLQYLGTRQVGFAAQGKKPGFYFGVRLIA